MLQGETKKTTPMIQHTSTTYDSTHAIAYKAIAWRPGPRLDIKTVLSTYDDFHVKDKTAVRTSYL